MKAEEHNITPHELAEEAIDEKPGGTVDQWAEGLNKRIDAHGKGNKWLLEWRYKKTLEKLGDFCKGIDAAAKRQAAPKVSWAGRPMTDTISVPTSKGRRQKLWDECSPPEFRDAVLREQANVDGRARSNAVRLKLVGVLEARPELMKLATLGEAIVAAGFQGADLDLDSLEL